MLGPTCRKLHTGSCLQVRRTSESPPLAMTSAGSAGHRGINNFGLTLELRASEAMPAFTKQSNLSMEQAEVRSFRCRTRR